MIQLLCNWNFVYAQCKYFENWTKKDENRLVRILNFRLIHDNLEQKIKIKFTK